MQRLVFILFLCLSIAAAVAGERDDLYAALDAERAVGDLQRALALYKTAATAADPDIKSRARLGVGRCLRRLGRFEEAKTALDSLLAAGPPAALRPRVDRELALVLKALGREEATPEEVERLRSELEKEKGEADRLRQSLARAEGTREELERLRAGLVEKDHAIRDLTSRLEFLGEGAADRRQRENELARRAELADYAVEQARILYRGARFEEAREWVRRAIDQDPTNGPARELLARLGDTLGNRERLVREVLRLLEKERRVRLDEARLATDDLLAQGQDLLLRGELDGAVAKFSECLALVDAHPFFARELVTRRERAGEFLRSAVARGGQAVADPTAGQTPAPDGVWRETIRGLLTDIASSRRPAGRDLRVYDLSELDDPIRGEAPIADRLSPTLRRPALGPLLATLIPALVHPAVGGNHIVVSHGSSLVVHAPADVQSEVAMLLTRLKMRQDEPTRVRVTALAVNPAALDAAGRAAGAEFESRGDTALAVLAPAVADRLRRGLLAGQNGRLLGEMEAVVLPGQTLGVEHLRSVGRGSGPAETLRFGLVSEILPVWTGRDFGVALSATVTRVAETIALPSKRGEEILLPSVSRGRASVAARVPAGGSLVLVGLENPFGERPFPIRSGLLLFVRVSPVAPVATPTESPPDAGGAVRVDLGGLAFRVPDEPAPAFAGERSRVVISRSGFLLRYLREALGEEALGAPGASLTIGRGTVWVRGDEQLVATVREVVDRLRETETRIVLIRVRAAALTREEEATLLHGLPPGGVVSDGEGIRTFIARGEAAGRIRYFVTGTAGRVPLVAERMAARSTQLVNLIRVTRFSFLKEYRAEEGGGRWPVYDAKDEGFALEARPVLLPNGTVDLGVRLRIARILDRRSPSPKDGEAATPQPPVLAVSEAAVRGALLPGEILVVSGLPAPTPTAGDRHRLVVLVEAAAEGKEK